MNQTLYILELVKSSGASVAGIIKASSLGRSQFNLNTNSILVFGLYHSKDELSLDWWGGEGGSPGNRKMEDIAAALIHRLRKNLEVKAYLLPYHAKKGGVFLKDAAVLAGLGTIGKNNLVISPEFGPRIRWRAIGLDSTVAPSEARLLFDPCADCDMPCRRACPQGAFAEGSYRRESCMHQMSKDEADQFVSLEDQANIDSDFNPVKYCRACEMACPFPSSNPVQMKKKRIVPNYDQV